MIEQRELLSAAQRFEMDAIDNWVEQAIDLFRKDGDAGKFIESAMIVFTQLKNRPVVVFGPLGFSATVMDKMYIAWPGGYQLIIKEAKKQGINPFENFIGERHQALSCLAQILEK